MRTWFGQLAREPLLHFFALGIGIFVVFGGRSGPGAQAPAEIVVTRGRIESLALSFGRTWQRPPTAAELDGLIRDYVREELAVREAKALGLDVDDVVVRRRLRQKLEFVSEDAAAQMEPSEQELRAWLAAYPERFRVERRFSFRQVFLDPERRGEQLADDASQLLAQLRADGGARAPGALGDPSLLDREFADIGTSELEGLFGEEFAAALGGLEPGRWEGPIGSAYGSHLVFVRERTGERPPELGEVRAAVLRDWTSAKRLEALEQLYQSLLGRQRVTIEAAPQVASGEPAGAPSGR